MSDETPPTLDDLFERYAAFVWRTVRHLGVRPADVPDVVQEVFLVVHRQLPGFEGRSTVRTWLYGICLRVASQHRRRAWVRREVPGAPAETGSDEPATTSDARLTLESMLDEIDDDKRAIVVLYEIEQLPMKEVAEIVGCPVQTAYSRLHAARDRLAELGRRTRRS
jgi:RNA polymerase sigma-70 factor (ECF subfamily)